MKAEDLREGSTVRPSTPEATPEVALPHKWVTSKGQTWCLECGMEVGPCDRSPYGHEGVEARKAEARRALRELVSDAQKLGIYDDVDGGTGK